MDEPAHPAESPSHRAKFCNECGSPLSAAASRTTQILPPPSRSETPTSERRLAVPALDQRAQRLVADGPHAGGRDHDDPVQVVVRRPEVRGLLDVPAVSVVSFAELEVAEAGALPPDSPQRPRGTGGERIELVVLGVVRRRLNHP